MPGLRNVGRRLGGIASGKRPLINLSKMKPIINIPEKIRNVAAGAGVEGIEDLEGVGRRIGERPRIRKLGRGLAMAGLVGGAVGLGVHSQRPGQTIKEAAFDTAFGDPQADVTMLGFPMTAADFFPILRAFDPLPDVHRLVDAAKYTYQHPEAGGLPQLLQTMGYEDKLNNWYMNQATANVGRGYTNINTDINSSIYDYKQPYERQGSYANQNRGIAADGSMVFGMYNMRMK